jgi:hypothetical protein
MHHMFINSSKIIEFMANITKTWMHTFYFIYLLFYSCLFYFTYLQLFYIITLPNIKIKKEDYLFLYIDK